jgi:4-hydroxybenzoate polyprenyltransferase
MRDNYRPTSRERERGSGDIRYEITRIVSVLVALVGLAIAYWSPNVGVFHFTLAFVVLPLGCIWYGREIGGFTADAEDDTHNPVGSLITYLGWIILFGMVAVLVWMQP